MAGLTGIGANHLALQLAPRQQAPPRQDFLQRLPPPPGAPAGATPAAVRAVEPVQVGPAAISHVLEGRGPGDLVRAIFRGVEQDFARGEAAIDQVVAAAGRGEELSPTKLLALQVQIQRYSEEVLVLSKVVQGAVDALKQLLKTQV